MEKLWLFDTTAKYSYTKYKHALDFARHVKYDIEPVNSIFDACACIGSNAIAFAKYGFNVLCTEVDYLRYKMLKHNIKISNLENILPLHADCFDYFPIINCNIVFIDAPWSGGKMYKTLRKFGLENLVFDKNRTVIDALKILKKNLNVKYVILKVPLRFYENNFKADNWWNYNNHKYCLIKMEKLRSPDCTLYL